MSRALDDLSSAFKPLAMELLARLTERGILVVIVDTARTLQEHRENLASGASKTSLSKHLPRALRGFAPIGPDAMKADAMDVCLYEQYALHGPKKLQWDASEPAWRMIGDIAEGLELRWGGRWRDPHDPGHVEYKVIAPNGTVIV